MRYPLLLLVCLCCDLATVQAAEVLQKKGQSIVVALNDGEARNIQPGANISLLDQGNEIMRGQIIRTNKNNRKAQIQISGNPDRIATGNVYRIANLTPEGSLRLWDGSDADVAWVNDAPSPPMKKEYVPWLTFDLGGGRRIFQDDDTIAVKDSAESIMSEGRFLDVIEPGNIFEARSYVNFLKVFSVGVIYHMDETKLKVNQQAVAINPQEVSGSFQVGPRFGVARIYALYNQVINSRSKAYLKAPTLVTDPNSSQEYEIEIKQTGREIGLGTQLRWGHVGLFAEALQSFDRKFELNITRKDGDSNRLQGIEIDSKFHATAETAYKSWQIGMTLDF